MSTMSSTVIGGTSTSTLTSPEPASARLTLEISFHLATMSSGRAASVHEQPSLASHAPCTLIDGQSRLPWQPPSSSTKTSDATETTP